MKNIFQKIALLLAVSMVAACSDDHRGEVISQDTGYEIDQDYVFVDIPPVLDFDPSNIVYLHGKSILNLSAKHDKEEGVTDIVEGNSFQFNIKLKKPLDRDLIVRLSEDLSLLDGHPNPNNLKSFPKGTFSIQDVTIPKGVREKSATLTFENTSLLKEKPGYLLPLRLELVDAKDGVAISKVRYSVFVHLNLDFGKNNIEPTNDPIEGIEFNENLTFESNKDRNLHYLNDGRLDRSSWYPSNEETYLTMILPEPTKVLGFKLYITSGRYCLGQFKVYVDEGSGFMSYGEVKRDTKGAPICVKFKKPVDIYAIKIDGMLTVGGAKQPDIYEVVFVK